MDLCGTGFSLWVFKPEGANPHKLKHALQKTMPRREGPGAEKKGEGSNVSLDVMLGESAGEAAFRRPPRRLRNHGEARRPHVAEKVRFAKPLDPSTASFRAFAARKRTTVFALILIASPVCGLRPMRALRCALTTRPIFGITNLPAPPLASLTASLNSSSKNCAATFFGVPTFSAMWATILDLLSGFAI